jgi:LacI family transcriptional regulator
MPMSHRPPRVSRLKDVAHLAGVSTATVSRILNDHGPASEEARNRVLRAAQELDYRSRPGWSFALPAAAE